MSGGIQLGPDFDDLRSHDPGGPPWWVWPAVAGLVTLAFGLVAWRLGWI